MTERGGRLHMRGMVGFTLIEVLIALCIFGIIAAIVIPAYVDRDARWTIVCGERTYENVVVRSRPRAGWGDDHGSRLWTFYRASDPDKKVIEADGCVAERTR